MAQITDKTDYGFTTLTDQATITWDTKGGRVAQVTLNGARTLATPQNVIAGQHYQLMVTQGAGGNHTLSVPAAFKFPNGGTLALSTDAAAVDIISLFYDGTNFYCSVLPGFNT